MAVISDDPARDVELRSASTESLLESLDAEEIFKLASLKDFRRWTSNWISLILGLCFRSGVQVPRLSPFSWRTRSARLPANLHQFLLDFDSTLGYPRRVLGIGVSRAAMECSLETLTTSSVLRRERTSH